MKKLVLTSISFVSAVMLAFSCVGGATVKISDATKTEPIEVLEEMNIIEGYEDGALHPELKLTRAQFAKVVCTAFPEFFNGSANVEFLDIDSSHWGYEYIMKAAKSNVLKGFPDNTFRPDENVTYEQAVAIICRLLGIYSYGDYPIAEVKQGMEYGITDCVDAFIGSELDRGQMAQLMVNALNYEENNEVEPAMNSNYYSKSQSIYLAPMPSVDGLVDYETSSGGGSTVFKEDGLMAYAPTTDYEIVVPEEIPQSYNTEEYVSENENVFKSPVTSPLSTFSIDTDTASYSNLRRFILNGTSIPDGSVRIEELLNYFDYQKSDADDGHPFGVKYRYGKCPWNENNQLAMITVSGDELKEAKPSNIVFLIDVSGSMYSYNKLPLVKQSLALLLDKLGESDTISIVTYASGTGVALEPTPATEKEKILGVIDSLRAGGSTSGASGINLAYELAEKSKIDGNNRVILCTDGDFNVGISSTADLKTLISEKRDSGIYLSVLGFGMGNYKDNKMETLADSGNGNYAYIDTLKEAKKVLVDDMSKTIYTIAKDVKIQTEFNPEKVKEYRLIGYENRLLNNEDFDNDKKDAGELGADARVTVLYEIVPQDSEVESELKYQTTGTTGSDELMTVKIRYKDPDGQESILCEYPMTEDEATKPDEDFYFASAVAQLGMLLNKSEFSGSSTYESIIDLARKGKGDDPYGIRCEFIQLVDLLRIIEK